jgi:hypothetical protein
VAAARERRSVLGSDRVRFATQSTTALPSKPGSLVHALERRLEGVPGVTIMAGFHYRFSVSVGARMGNRIARSVVDSQLLPR